jgi:di/tricarboxylate transporter
MCAFIFVFKKNLTYKSEKNEVPKSKKMESMEKNALFITALVVILWLSESYHGISAAYVALIGVALMFITRIINLKDFKAVNMNLLIFLTAEFAIGKVIVGSGVADKMSSYLIQFFPTAESIWYIPFIIVLIMVLHMVMGSLITALSVSIPTLISITAGTLSSEFIVLLVTVSVCFHYMMPFHHVTIMLGYGNDFYENRHVLKMGIYLTLITFAVVLFNYIPWWKIIAIF